MADPIEQAILSLCQDCETGRTFAPADVAKHLAQDDDHGPDAWRSKLGAVKRAAQKLATQGLVVIYRKGRPVDPTDLKGVYRLGPPGGTAEASDDSEPEA